MEESLIQMVSQLERTVWVLGCLTALFVMGFVIVSVAFGWSVWRRHLTGAPRFDVEQADLLFQRGEFLQLLRFSQGHIKQYPYSVEALWYIGIAQYSQGDYQGAFTAFDRVQQINPAWREDASAYLNAIQQYETELSERGGRLLN